MKSISTKPKVPKFKVPKAPRPKNVSNIKVPKIKGMINPFKFSK